MRRPASGASWTAHRIADTLPSSSANSPRRFRISFLLRASSIHKAGHYAIAMKAQRVERETTMGGPWERHQIGKFDTTTMKRTVVLVAFAATIALALGAVATASGGPATFYSFGSAGNGELGYDPSTIFPGSTNPVPTLVTVSNSGGPLSAAAGPFHSAVVTADGQLYTF